MLRSLILSLVLFSSAALAAPIDDALKSYDQGDFAQAAKLLPDLAKAGDARAQYSLAVMYFYGRGLPEDEKLALEWARKSAEQGNLDAMFFVGNIYIFGDKVPAITDDPDLEAAKWFFEAASRGHAEAEYGLGLLFLAGKGVVQSNDEAMTWIRRAAEHGHTGAKNFLGGGGHAGGN